MEKGRARRLAGALLAAIAATLLASLAALARVPAPARAAHACHCPVKMPCCEAGLCHGGEDDDRSSGPSWSGCRDEAPDRADIPLLSTAFEAPLPGTGAALAEPSVGRAALLACTADDPRAPAPSTPPPRGSLAPC